MAENWLSRISNRVGQSVSNFGNRFADHPIQSGLSTLLGSLNPLLGAAARFGFDRYNQSQAPDALPGITSPNTFDGSTNSPGMSGALGIPNYAMGDPGWQPVNSFGTGNFDGSLPPLLDLNYGQNPQEYINADGGLPGITGPNVYSGSNSRGPSHSSASGNLQSLGGMGRTVGHATMGQVEQMLSGGMRGRGERQLFSPHELNDERAEAKKLGLTLNQYRSQS